MLLRLVVLFAALLSSEFVRAAPALEVYGGLPGVELMSLSPSGDRYALIAVVGEERKLLVMSYDGHVLSAAGVGDAKVMSIRWAGENHLLVVVHSTFKAPLMFKQDYELSSVINIDLAKHSAKPIFGNLQSVASAVFGIYGTSASDAHLFGYFGGISYERTFGGEFIFTHGYSDLYRVDLDTFDTKRFAPGNEFTQDWLVSKEGVVVAHSDYRTEDGRWRLYADGDGHKVLLERGDPQGDIDVMGPGRSPGTVLVADNSGDRDLAEEVSIASGATEELFRDVDVIDYLFDRDSNQLIGALTQEEPGATFFDPALLARFNGARRAFPRLKVSLVSYSNHLNRMVVETEGANDSGTYWLVDTASGKADPVARPYPLVRDYDVGVTSKYRYTAGDQLPIEGILTLPRGREPKNLPLVVMPHGGPIGVHDEVGFDWWAQAYASRGYAVLQPNYRGSSGYGRVFRQSGFGQWGRKMQSDLSDGVAALAKDGTIDPKRVCIVGASYGGYAALAGVTLQQGIYRCAVSVAGLADLRRFFTWQTERHGYRSYATRFWRSALGADSEGDAVMVSLSPSFAAARADAPILLIHGKDDTVVPIEQSEAMVSALKREGKPYEFVVMKGEDHWLSRGATRIEMLNAAVAFVQKYNPASGN